MKRFLLTILSLILMLVLAISLVGCGAENPSIEISEDGYWVINGEKTNVKAEAESAGGDNSQQIGRAHV